MAKLLGRPYADRLRHVKFGVMLMHNKETDTWEKTATRYKRPAASIVHGSIFIAAAAVAAEIDGLSPFLSVAKHPQ